MNPETLRPIARSLLLHTSVLSGLISPAASGSLTIDPSASALIRSLSIGIGLSLGLSVFLLLSLVLEVLLGALVSGPVLGGDDAIAGHAVDRTCSDRLLVGVRAWDDVRLGDMVDATHCEGVS